MMLHMMPDEDVVLYAFARCWAGWHPRRIYTPLNAEAFQEKAGLPPDRFKVALTRLLGQGILAARGAIRPPTEAHWMYQFTMEGLKMAERKGYLSAEEIEMAFP